MGNSSRPGAFISFLPSAVSNFNLQGTEVVIIDVLRASTTIVAALETGAEYIVPCKSVEETIRQKNHGYLIAGERNSQKLDGFDFGNSPAEITAQNDLPHPLALTTTNGTALIENCMNADKILIGSFVNLSAIVNYLKHSGKKIILACAGREGGFSLEDALFAGAVASELPIETPSKSWKIGAKLFQHANSRGLAGYIKQNASHCRKLLENGNADDVRICLSIDLYSSLPVMSNKRIFPEK